MIGICRQDRQGRKLLDVAAHCRPTVSVSMAPGIRGAVALAVGAVLAGCGAGLQPLKTSRAASRAAAGVPRRQAGAAGPAGIAIVTLPALGSFSYRCDQNGQQVAAALSGAPAPDTGTSVTVEGDHRVHLHQHIVLSAGHTATRTTAPGAYRSLTWRIINTTEPRSVVATVRLRFHVGLVRSGGKALLDCTLRSWTVSEKVLEHTARWTNPSPWA